MKCEYGGVPALIVDGVLTVGECPDAAIGFFEEQKRDGTPTASRRGYCKPHVTRLREHGRYEERGLQLAGPFRGFWGPETGNGGPTHG